LISIDSLPSHVVVCINLMSGECCANIE